MPPLERLWPDIGTDLQIIAYYRLSMLINTGLIEFSEPATHIASFTCRSRVYFIDGDGVLAVLPFDAHDEIDYFIDAFLPHCKNPPIQVWVLKDDRVIMQFECPDPADR
ncbi:MAG TPA: hypothetical protein PKD44_08680 [Nitrosomonas sp.]|nr:hypothetical protein [Nitrosomonas sp.]HNJ38225.1 hypothetical protein [Nitrosomonas sp.]